jgi:hypothetical protein
VQGTDKTAPRFFSEAFAVKAKAKAMEQSMYKLLAAAAVSLALATPLAAQTAPPAPAPAGKTAGQTQYYTANAGDLRASKLIGTSVKNDAGDSVGDVNEVLLSKDGKVAAVVIGVGGFLGMGERQIAVPFASLHVSQDANGTTQTTMPGATKDSLKAAPEWKWPKKS